jgi:predicted transposase/invertase (TIGR01784 family)
MPRKLISFSWAMKKLLRSKANFDILEGFLSELLKETIQILAILESESNQENRQDKFNRIDLKVKNHKNEVIVVEVRYERQFDYLQRVVFGTDKAIPEHLQEGDPYSDVVRVISVNILYFDLGQGEDYVYHGLTHFKGLHWHDTLQLSEDQQALYQKNQLQELFPEHYLIKVNNFDDIVEDTLDEWIYFLKNAEIKSDFKAKGIKKAQQTLGILKLSEKERQAYARYQDNLHYQASMVESSYTIGMLKGRKKGIEEGLKKGREEGMKESVRKRQNEQSKEIALNLLSISDLDRQTIAQVTGLTTEDIEQLNQKR